MATGGGGARREAAAPPLPAPEGCPSDRVALHQLAEQLAAALAEKEQLQQDVATLCEARASRGGVGGMLSAATGYLLSDQASSLRQDNALLRQQLRALAGERDGLHEDMAQLRGSKVLSDKGWREATRRAGELEKELTFFRTANARAITDRDTVAFECDQLRTRLASSEDRTRELEVALDAEKSRSAAVRQAFEAAASRERSTAAERLKEAAGDAAAERARLKAQRAALHEMDEARDKIKVELLTAQAAKQQAQATQQLAERKSAAAEERAAAAEERAAAAEGRAVSAEDRTRELAAASDELSAQAAAAREQAARARAQAATLQRQLNERGAREGELETTLEQLTAALVAAQAGLKELQQQQAHAWRPRQAARTAAAAGGNAYVAAQSPADADAGAAGGCDGGRAAPEVRAGSAAPPPPPPPPSLASCDSLPRDRELLAMRRELEERDALNAALQEHCSRLKERLAAAVREKVEALLLAAGAGTAPSGGGTGGAGVAAGRGGGGSGGGSGAGGGGPGDGAVGAAVAANERRIAASAAAPGRDAGGGGDQSPKKAPGGDGGKAGGGGAAAGRVVPARVHLTSR